MSRAIKAGEAYVKLSVRASDMERGLLRAQRMLNSFARSATRIGMAAGAAGAGMAMAFKPAIDAAAKWESSMFKANAIFKEGAPDVISWATELGRQYGRSRRSLVDFAAISSLMFKNLGVEQEKALQMSKDLAVRTITHANLYQHPTEDMQLRFIRLLSGSAEVLDQFGVNAKEAAIKQEMLRMGFKTHEFNEYTKILARYNILMKDTAVSMEAGIPNTYLDNIERLSASFERMNEELGSQAIREFSNVFKALSSVFEMLAAQPELLAKIATGAVGVTVALLATSALLISLGVVTKLLWLISVPMGLLLKHGLKLTALQFTGLQRGVAGVKHAFKGAAKGADNLKKDLKIIGRLRSREFSGFRVMDPLTDELVSAKRLKELQRLRATPGAGFAYGAQLETVAMQGRMSKMAAASRVFSRRMRGPGESVAKFTKASGRMAGGLLRRLLPIAEAIYLASEAWNFFVAVGSSALKQLMEFVKQFIADLGMLPPIMKTIIGDPQRGYELLDMWLDTVHEEIKFRFKVIGEDAWQAFKDGFERLAFAPLSLQRGMINWLEGQGVPRGLARTIVDPGGIGSLLFAEEGTTERAIVKALAKRFELDKTNIPFLRGLGTDVDPTSLAVTELFKTLGIESAGSRESRLAEEYKDVRKARLSLMLQKEMWGRDAISGLASMLHDPFFGFGPKPDPIKDVEPDSDITKAIKSIDIDSSVFHGRGTEAFRQMHQSNDYQKQIEQNTKDTAEATKDLSMKIGNGVVWV